MTQNIGVASVDQAGDTYVLRGALNLINGDFTVQSGDILMRGGNHLRIYTPDNSLFVSLSFDGAGLHINWPLMMVAGIQPSSPDNTTVSPGSLWGGSGVPNNANGNNGDFYFRTDTPGTANQRIYVRSAGAWVGIV